MKMSPNKEKHNNYVRPPEENSQGCIWLHNILESVIFKARDSWKWSASNCSVEIEDGMDTDLREGNVPVWLNIQFFIVHVQMA